MWVQLFAFFTITQNLKVGEILSLNPRCVKWKFSSIFVAIDRAEVVVHLTPYHDFIGVFLDGTVSYLTDSNTYSSSLWQRQQQQFKWRIFMWKNKQKLQRLLLLFKWIMSVPDCWVIVLYFVALTRQINSPKLRFSVGCFVSFTHKILPNPPTIKQNLWQ